MSPGSATLGAPTASSAGRPSQYAGDEGLPLVGQSVLPRPAGLRLAMQLGY